MITVIRLKPTSTVVHLSGGRCDGLAYAAASTGPCGVAFVVDGRRVVQVENRADGQCFVGEATGFQLIRLHDTLNGAEGLYAFATRPVALEKLLTVLNERHPAPERIEELETINL